MLGTRKQKFAREPEPRSKGLTPLNIVLSKCPSASALSTGRRYINVSTNERRRSHSEGEGPPRGAALHPGFSRIHLCHQVRRKLHGRPRPGGPDAGRQRHRLSRRRRDQRRRGPRRRQGDHAGDGGLRDEGDLRQRDAGHRRGDDRHRQADARRGRQPGGLRGDRARRRPGQGHARRQRPRLPEAARRTTTATRSTSASSARSAR